MSDKIKTKTPEPVGSTDLLGKVILGRLICERILFVFAKQGRIKCYSGDELRPIQPEIEADGWVHTATIDPARWIEHIANGEDDPSDVLDELQFKPNAKSEPPAL